MTTKELDACIGMITSYIANHPELDVYRSELNLAKLFAKGVEGMENTDLSDGSKTKMIKVLGEGGWTFSYQNLVGKDGKSTYFVDFVVGDTTINNIDFVLFEYVFQLYVTKYI